MANRVELSEDLLEDVVGGKITYTWSNGAGTCGLSGNNKYKFNDKTKFLNFLSDCLINKGMTDVEALTAALSAGVIWR